MKITTALVLLLAALSHAAPSPLTPAAGSMIWIEGDSTLHPFSSSSTAVALEMTLDRASGESPAAAAKGQKAAKLTVKVPVASLKSEHGGLDKNLQKALKASENPQIVFTLESYRVLAQAPLKLAASGTLSIAGTSKPVTLQADVVEKDGKLLVDGRQALVMSEFGVKPPKMMMGAVKVADKISVVYHLILEGL